MCKIDLNKIEYFVERIVNQLKISLGCLIRSLIQLSIVNSHWLLRYSLFNLNYYNYTGINRDKLYS